MDIVVQRQARAVPGDPLDRRDAAWNGQELDRAVDLEWSRRQGQGQAARPVRSVGQVITAPQPGLVRRPVGEGRDLQRPVVGCPGHRRDRQVAVLQPLLNIDVSPGDQPAVVDDKGFDAGASAAQFDGAVLADQAALAAAVHADQGPVGLFAKEAARIEAAPVFFRHGLDEGRGVLAEGQGFNLDLVQGVGGRLPRPQSLAGAGGADHVRGGDRPQRLQPQPARGRLGRAQPIDAAVSALHGRQFAPVPPVYRRRNPIVGRRAPLAPAQGQAAELAFVSQVQRQGRGFAHQRGPGGLGVQIDGVGGGRLRSAVGGDRLRRHGGIDRQGAQAQLVDLDRPLAAFHRDHDELDPLGATQHRLGAWPPGLGDLAALDDELGPAVGEVVARRLFPPDVFGRGVGQLDLEGVDRPGAAHPEADLVIIGQVERQGPAEHRIARLAVEVVVEPDRATVVSRHGADGGVNVGGGAGLPSRGVVHGVEDARVLRDGGGGHQGGAEREGGGQDTHSEYSS